VFAVSRDRCSADQNRIDQPSFHVGMGVSVFESAVQAARNDSPLRSNKHERERQQPSQHPQERTSSAGSQSAPDHTNH